MLLLSAQRVPGAGVRDTAATLPIGSHRGAITGGADSAWTVWWKAGEVTYSLQLTPAEGGTLTLEQFKREVARLKWNS